MGVTGRPVRNSNTAARNSTAPSPAAASAPPRVSTKLTSRRAARRISAAGACPSPSTRRGSGTPTVRAASTAKLPKGTNTTPGGARAGATIARWRSRPNRSSARAPSPASHSRIVSAQTPWRRATAATRSPRSTAATAEKITVTLVTLPGSTSRGSTRSRCRHVAQRASATASTTNSPTARCNLRSTRIRVSRTATPPQKAQRQPGNKSRPPAVTNAA